MGMPLPVPHFTIDMLDDFPDDGNRYELLEGTLLVTPAPSMEHQVVATRIAHLLLDALSDGRDAQVVAVGAIQRGNNTQLQPDILVFPSSVALTANWRDIGEWWLAVEVMSPSSRIYDREVKRDAYLALGVEEYWLVDLRRKSLEIWRKGEPGPHLATAAVEWRPASLGRTITIRLADIFGQPGDG